MKTGVQLIAAERKRQIEKEGWSEEHDKSHTGGTLCDAAICYAKTAQRKETETIPPSGWPFSSVWWKPKSRIRNLVRAGALIAAEIDRISP